MNKLEQLSNLFVQVRDNPLCHNVQSTPFYWLLTYGDIKSPKAASCARTFGDVYCMERFLELLEKHKSTPATPESES